VGHVVMHGLWKRVHLVHGFTSRVRSLWKHITRASMEVLWTRTSHVVHHWGGCSMGMGCISGVAAAVAAATFLLTRVNLCHDHLWIHPTTVMEALKGQKVTDVVFLQGKGSTIGATYSQVHSNLLPLLVLGHLNHTSSFLDCVI
jgi:hypothetical protein